MDSTLSHLKGLGERVETANPVASMVVGSGTVFGAVVNVKMMPLFQKWQSGSKPNAMSPPFKKYALRICN